MDDMMAVLILIFATAPALVLVLAATLEALT